MKNNAKSDYTIRFVDKALRYLTKNTDLNKPEEVKNFIANKNVSNGYKKNLCLAYDKYCQYYQIQWEIPKYKPQAKMVQIPTKAKLEALIARAGLKLGIKLRISKETGLRPIELCNLLVKNVDMDKKTIYPTTAKNGAGRILKISSNLTTAIENHIKRNELKSSDNLFNATAEEYGKYYRQMRNNLAKKLNDETLKTIRLYDFRHFFATMLYAKTRDILYVKQQMGHRKIGTTLIYIQLLNITDEEYTCKTASNVKQAAELIEAGFEHVVDKDGIMLFRKRK